MPSRSVTTSDLPRRRSALPHFVAAQCLVMAVAALTILSGCRSGGDEVGDTLPPPAVLPEDAAPDHRPTGREIPIALGDQLEVVVPEDPSLRGTYVVREGGHILLGRFGRVPVAGRTLAEVERQVKAMLEQDQLTKATVLIDRLNPRQLKDPVASGDKILVYMTGHVNRPGQHVLTLPEGRDLGIYEAILITGGTGRFADERDVHILRSDQENRRHRIPVDLRGIKNGDIPDIPIGNGDIVVVPEKVFGF